MNKWRGALLYTITYDSVTKLFEMNNFTTNYSPVYLRAIEFVGVVIGKRRRLDGWGWCGRHFNSDGRWECKVYVLGWRLEIG
jgi:hypothetical protein